ncbi:MAG TPA: hypothetical protein VER11_31660 [Polyangiaceae bacterium]|nr:hypothetical protein [Polyangiaceae bacterium]
MSIRRFVAARVAGLRARVGRLARIDHASVGIRPQDRPYAPSAAHFQAANRRLAQIERSAAARLQHLERTFRQAPTERVLIDTALVERELDRARRAYGLFFEVFGQRGTTFAPALAAHDAIAADCYAAVRAAAPRIFEGAILKPLCYMEHGYSPATMRRGVTLSRLLGEANPFPIIRIPWDREHPWDAVFLHEVAHNLQADLRIWQENQQAVQRRVLSIAGDRISAAVYGRWHKEIFADLAALLLGGPAAAWGMALFLAHPSPRAMTFRPGSAHPVSYLRVLMLSEMLRRMNFPAEAARLRGVWTTIYDPARGHRLPGPLLQGAPRVIPEVVDEIAFQTRRNLAHRALADVIPFSPADEDSIRHAATRLERGEAESELPARFMLSAASYALARGRTAPAALSRLVLRSLNAQRLENLTQAASSAA